MDSIATYWDHLKPYIYYLAFGAAGGITYQAFCNKQIRLLVLLKGAVVGGFVGMITGMFAKGHGLNQDFQYALAGAAGFLGGLTILIVAAIIIQRFSGNPSETLDCVDRISGLRNKEGD